ncbi:MAG TPA: LysM domain-containing protein [Ilumatobacteraceae bacterium]|jgi:LysM repeat protein
MRYSARIACLLVAASGGVIVACGSSARSAKDTLPPIITTTTTTTMPPTTTTIPDFYVIQKGDTLGAIAAKFGISRADLAAFNGITNINKIDAGEKLKIPHPGDIITTTTVAPSTP